VDNRRRRRRARRLISTFVAFATIVFPRLTFAQRFDEAGVRALFAAFSNVALDRNDFTLGGGAVANSDWIITLEK